MISKPNPTTSATSPAGQRDLFPATIPEAFGFWPKPDPDAYMAMLEATAPVIPIRNLIAQYAPAGKQIELLITEVGYGLKAGSEEGEIGFGLSNAAFEKAHLNELGNYLPRTLLSNLSLGVPTVWYELNSLIEKPLSPSQHSQNPGMITWGYTPGVAAVRVLSDTLRGYSFFRRLEIGDPNDDFVFELRNGQRRALALWPDAETEREIVLPLTAGAGTLVSYEGVGVESGVKTPMQWPANELKLTLNNWPKYLLIKEATP